MRLLNAILSVVMANIAFCFGAMLFEMGAVGWSVPAWILASAFLLTITREE